MSAAIVGQGWAAPAPVAQRQLWDEFFAEHYGHSPVARLIWERSCVATRHGVVDPRIEDASAWGTDARMRRFAQEAPSLGKDALTSALAAAEIGPGDIGQLTVVSCTGYATPGLDIVLARDLGMSADVQRLHIGHMGCYAALPGLAQVADAAGRRGKPAALLCVELTSLHIQAPTDDTEQAVAHALFSDAAAAAVVSPAGAGLEVVDVMARTDHSAADLMSWDITDHGFRMGLSSRIPGVLAAQVTGAVTDLLRAHGLSIRDVAAWAIHPGGPRIVDLVGQRLGLEESLLEDSRAVLRDHGNCSSATILRIVQRIAERQSLDRGSPVVALAFGPGLTLYGALLRQA
ncbi:MAG TPA: 3-oxoacyl-[acyl-carrier-protein] synthase III C-terminal domain-containing protein [Egibacteraceae bacterium]|nr:3-oxoacyl-[acyl-carrier-protein] synthase III C-terminal domain-containing protein [Egibacteraceae bacterium]